MNNNPEQKNLKRANHDIAPQYYDESRKEYRYTRGDRQGSFVTDKEAVRKLEEIRVKIEEASEQDGEEESDEIVAEILEDIKAIFENKPSTQSVADENVKSTLDDLYQYLENHDAVSVLNSIENYLQGRFPVDYSDRPILVRTINPEDDDSEWGFVTEGEFEEHTGNDDRHKTQDDRDAISSVSRKANQSDFNSLITRIGQNDDLETDEKNTIIAAINGLFQKTKTHQDDETKHTTQAEKDKLSGIESGAQVNQVDSVNGQTGAVSVSKSDVALGSVQNYGIATQSQAEAGTENNAYMTPVRVAEAIESSEKYFVIGTFTGDQNSNQTIDVGFEPSAVLIQNYQRNSDGYFDNGLVTAERPLAQTNINETSLVEVRSNGFWVSSANSSFSSHRQTYSYIAFK